MLPLRKRLILSLTPISYWVSAKGEPGETTGGHDAGREQGAPGNERKTITKDPFSDFGTEHRQDEGPRAP